MYDFLLHCSYFYPFCIIPHTVPVLCIFINSTYSVSCLQVVHTYEGHNHDVHLLLPFGQHLISVDTESQVIIWDIQTEGNTSYIWNYVMHFLISCFSDTFYICMYANK